MKKRPTSKRSTFYFAFACALLVLSFTTAWACSVPVFRYALERWPADSYEVVVFHESELNSEAEKLVTQLRKASVTRESSANVSNIEIRLVNLNSELNADDQALWEQQKDAKGPWMAVMSPLPRLQEKRQLMWSAAFDVKNVKTFLDSPSRREVARRLLSGQSAVWILLEGKDQAETDKIHETIRKRLAHLELTQELPEIDEQDVTDGLLQLDPDALKIKYSVIRLKRDDPAEKFFVDMLLETESDLRDPEFVDKPMAFPVFGRGRALYALIGAGINDDMIDEACEFLAGSCSCEVKDQNPGTDLMMSVNWEKLIQPTIEIDNELPPLVGLGQFVKTSALDDEKQVAKVTEPDNNDAEIANDVVTTTETTQPDDDKILTDDTTASSLSKPDETPSPATATSPNSSPLLRNLSIVIGIGVLFVAVSVLMSRRRKQS